MVRIHHFSGFFLVPPAGRVLHLAARLLLARPSRYPHQAMSCRSRGCTDGTGRTGRDVVRSAGSRATQTERETTTSRSGKRGEASSAHRRSLCVIGANQRAERIFADSHHHVANISGRCANQKRGRNVKTLPGYFFNPLGEGTHQWGFSIRYREPTQPRANALGRGPGGARQNHKTRRHDRTGRPAQKPWELKIEEAERRRMSHSRWWGSTNCGCKPQHGPKKEMRQILIRARQTGAGPTPSHGAPGPARGCEGLREMPGRALLKGLRGPARA